jgi:hypothetical protein
VTVTCQAASTVIRCFSGLSGFSQSDMLSVPAMDQDKTVSWLTCDPTVHSSPSRLTCQTVTGLHCSVLELPEERVPDHLRQSVGPEFDNRRAQLLRDHNERQLDRERYQSRVAAQWFACDLSGRDTDRGRTVLFGLPGFSAQIERAIVHHEHTRGQGIDIHGNDPALGEQFLPQAGKERLVLLVARNLQSQAIGCAMDYVGLRSREHVPRAGRAPALAVCSRTSRCNAVSRPAKGWPHDMHRFGLFRLGPAARRHQR